jgi:hypothetical protein
MEPKTYRDAIIAAQGSTFLWTQDYARTHRVVAERLRDFGLAAALVLLASGAAGFLSMQLGR